MEKFQMLFPFSIPSCTNTAVSSSMINTNPYDHIINNYNFQGNHHHSTSSSNGFLELMNAQIHPQHHQFHNSTQEFLPRSTTHVSEEINSKDVANSKINGGHENNGDIMDSSAAVNKIKGQKKIKKQKYAFQTRSQVDILDDGYRWRKYGQKAVKNNKFPRSYYKCTHQGCNVKKQVQRLTKDENIVVTTYEGMHTHSIEKPTDNFEHILSQMQLYTPY